MHIIMSGRAQQYAAQSLSQALSLAACACTCSICMHACTCMQRFNGLLKPALALCHACYLDNAQLTEHIVVALVHVSCWPECCLLGSAKCVCTGSAALDALCHGHRTYVSAPLTLEVCTMALFLRVECLIQVSSNHLQDNECPHQPLP